MAATAIVQSADGRLWVGSAGGLSCHDGRQVVVVEFEGVSNREAPVLHVAVAEQDVLVSRRDGVWRTVPGRTLARRLPATETVEPRAAAAGQDGSCWILGKRGLFLHDARGTLATIQTWGEDTAWRSLVAGAAGVWAASADAVYCLTSQGRPAVQRYPVEGRVQATAVDQDGVIVATQDGVHRVDREGRARRLVTRPAEGPRVTIAPGAMHHWYLDASGLWRMAADGSSFRRVQLIDGSTRLAREDLLTVHVSRDGILWVGTLNGGVLRTRLVSGIDRFELDLLMPEDRVTAMVEDRGRMWLGSLRGVLLQEAGDGWQAVPVPWPVALPHQSPKHESIQGLCIGPDGALVVATRNRGVWRLRDGWHCLLPSSREVRALTQLADVLLVSADRSVVRVPLGQEPGVSDAVARPQELPAPGRPAQIEATAEGTLWLAAYLGGLWFQPPGVATFEPRGEWAGDTVLGLCATSSGRQLWVTTMDGLWHFDPLGAVRRLVVSSSRSTPFFMVSRAPKEALWLANQKELGCYSEDIGRVLVLPLGCGARPPGFEARSRYQRSNSETWLGTRDRGYLRLRGEAPDALRWPVQVSRVLVHVDGEWHSFPGGTPFRLTLNGDPQAVAIQPLLIEWTLDVPPAYELHLYGRRDNALTVAAHGLATGLKPDTYSISAMVDHPNGDVQTVLLGQLEILGPPPRWPYGVSVGLVAVLLVILGRRRYIHLLRRSSLHMDLRQAAEAIPGEPAQVLNLARLAVAVGEDCWRRTDASHASVWVRPHGTGRHLLARFGHVCPVAEERASRCCAEGSRLSDQVVVRREGREVDLLLCVREVPGLEFEVLLKDPARHDPPTIVELERATWPLVTSLRQQGHLELVESELSRRGVAAEAEAHDLQGPLTVLRTAAFLAEQDVANGHSHRLAEFTSRIQAATDRIVLGVNELILRAQPPFRLKLAATDPGAIVERVARDLAPSAEAKRTRILVASCTTPVAVLLDRSWFVRVVENVIFNALKYSPPGSTIHVAMEASAREFVVHVDDEGPGFSANEREAVFLAGVTGSAQPTAGEPKTGMGLWVARQAMRAMGGRIWVGERQGAGARISLALPRSNA